MEIKHNSKQSQFIRGSSPSLDSIFLTPDVSLILNLNVRQPCFVLTELPYLDAKQSDLINFRKKFTPNHAAFYLATNVLKPFIHVVNEGYYLPGLRHTRFWEGNSRFFQYHGTCFDVTDVAGILQNWATEKAYSKEDYLHAFSVSFWAERHASDLQHFFQEEKNVVAGPTNIYPQPRANHDLMAYARNRKLVIFNDESLRRALKFASRATIKGKVTKGQRCTAMLVAAVQAAVLQPLIDSNAIGIKFKQFKNQKFEQYCDKILIRNWRETEVGKKLLLARTTNDYSPLFSATFSIDQRFVTPGELYIRISQDKLFSLAIEARYLNQEMLLLSPNQINRRHPEFVGRFHFTEKPFDFDDLILKIEAQNELIINTSDEALIDLYQEEIVKLLEKNTKNILQYLNASSANGEEIIKKIGFIATAATALMHNYPEKIEALLQVGKKIYTDSHSQEILKQLPKRRLEYAEQLFEAMSLAAEYVDDKLGVRHRLFSIY